MRACDSAPPPQLNASLKSEDILAEFEQDAFGEGREVTGMGEKEKGKKTEVKDEEAEEEEKEEEDDDLDKKREECDADDKKRVEEM